MQLVDNKVFMQSLGQMKCMPGFQTVKAKYQADTKAFFDSKTNLEFTTKFKNVEFSSPSNNAGGGADPAAPP
jgi:hypothetical protein